MIDFKIDPIFWISEPFRKKKIKFKDEYNALAFGLIYGFVLNCFFLIWFYLIETFIIVVT